MYFKIQWNIENIIKIAIQHLEINQISVLNKCVFPNHRIVTAEIRLSLRKNATRTTTTIPYEWALLNNKYIRDKYVIALRNKFNALQEKTETRTPNDEYENFVNAHQEVAAKYIPTKHTTKSRVPWETLAV